MEKRDCLAGLRVNRSNVTAFVTVAQHARIRQVLGCRNPAVLATDDVINLVRKPGVILMDKAVFATMIRAARYLGSESFADITGHAKEFGAPSP